MFKILHFDAWLDKEGLIRGLLCLIPAFILCIITKNIFYLKIGLLTISLLIGMERCQRSILLLAVHAVAIGLSVIIFFFAQRFSPFLYVAVCALYAYLSIWIARSGWQWHAVGNFTFIPALYLGYELNTATPESSYLQLANILVLGIPIAIVSVLFASLAYAPKRWSMNWPTFTISPVEQRKATHGALIRALAVALTASAVSYFHINLGNWVIWSSASVVTGEIISSSQKGWDRLFGALFGVLLSIPFLFFIPQSPLLVGIGMTLILLSLVGFKHYRLGFATRCFCIVITAAAYGKGFGVGIDRLEFVLLGGFTGITIIYLIQKIKQI